MPGEMRNASLQTGGAIGKGRKKRGLLERLEEGQGGSEAGALWGQGSE